MRSSHHHYQQHHNSFTLPQIKISDVDTLLKPAGQRISEDWESGVKALGSIPGYRYSAGKSRLSLSLALSLFLFLAILFFTAQPETARTCFAKQQYRLTHYEIQKLLY